MARESEAGFLTLKLSLLASCGVCMCVYTHIRAYVLSPSP